MQIQVTAYPSVKVQLEGKECTVPAWIANYASGNPNARETLVKNTPEGPMIVDVRVISTLADYKEHTTLTSKDILAAIEITYGKQPTKARRAELAKLGELLRDALNAEEEGQ